jgi:hypothetical protein
MDQGGNAGSLLRLFDFAQAHDIASARGPTSESSWYLPGKLLGGAFPRSEAELLAICSHASVVVNLCEDKEFRGPLRRAEEYVLPPACRLVRLPIEDGMVPETIERFRQQLEPLAEELVNGAVLYVHCFGGVGRTGIVCACLLSHIWPAASALDLLRYRVFFAARSNHLKRARRYVQAAYRAREIAYGDSPEFVHQKLFVVEYAKLLGRRLE